MPGSTFAVAEEAGTRDVKQKVAVALVVTGAAAGAAYLGYQVYKYRTSAKDEASEQDVSPASKTEDKQPEAKSETSPDESTTKDEHKMVEKPVPEKSQEPPADTSVSSEKSQPPPVAPKPAVRKPPAKAEKVEDEKSGAPKAPVEVNEPDDDNGIVVIERTTQAESLKAAPPAVQPPSPSSSQEPISFDGSIITHEKADVANLDWAAQCDETEEAKKKEKPVEKPDEKKVTPKRIPVMEKKAGQRHSKPVHKEDPPVENKKEAEPKKVSQLKTAEPPPPPPSPSNDEDSR